MHDSLATPWSIAHQTSVYGISQGKILDWVVISFSRSSSRPWGIKPTSRWVLYHWVTEEASPKLACTLSIPLWSLCVWGKLICKLISAKESVAHIVSSEFMTRQRNNWYAYLGNCSSLRKSSHLPNVSAFLVFSFFLFNCYI